MVWLLPLAADGCHFISSACDIRFETKMPSPSTWATTVHKLSHTKPKHGPWKITCYIHLHLCWCLRQIKVNTPYMDPMGRSAPSSPDRCREVGIVRPPRIELIDHHLGQKWTKRWIHHKYGEYRSVHIYIYKHKTMQMMFHSVELCKIYTSRKTDLQEKKKWQLEIITLSPGHLAPYITGAHWWPSVSWNTAPQTQSKVPCCTSCT